MSGPLYVPALTLPPQHRHRMVVLEPLNKLLQAKWDLLIPRFFFNFLCYLMYMFLFTAVAYHQPALEKVQQVGGGRGWGACWGREASWDQPRKKIGQGLPTPTRT